MLSSWGKILLLSLMLVVAGCVRTAGTPFEPIADAGTPITQPTDVPTEQSMPTETATVAATADAASAEETPTEAVTQIPITVVVPTETPLPILEVTNTPTNTAVPTDTSIPANTTEPSNAQTADATSTEVGASAQATSALPSGPSGPVEIATNTPLPTATPVTPAADLQPTPTAIGEEDTTAASPDDECTYIVRPGDNAYRIAVNNNITIAELREANPDELFGQNPIIQPGDVLTIPGCEEPTATATPPALTDDETTDTAEIPDGYIEYTVRSGDTLVAIARRYDTTVDEIVTINELANPNVLNIGDVLLVPDLNTTD